MVGRLVAVVVAAAALAGAAGAVRAGEFRVDVHGLDGLGLTIAELDEDVRGAHSDWLKEKRDQRIEFSGKTGGQWRACRFSFVPKADGVVELILMGRFKGGWVNYDCIAADGRPLPNGGFETIAATPDGRPESWWGNGKVGKDGGADGRNYIRTAHDFRFVQRLPVRKGTPVAISLQCRDDQAEK